MRFNPWPKKELRELIPHNARALLHIFSSLRTRNFRLYFLGQCVTLCGVWIQNIAMSWLVYRLSDSVVLLATVNFANMIPSLIFTPFAGVISDRFNKYRILLTTQSLFMVQALVLATLTLSGYVQVWHIIMISGFAGIIAAVESPARQSFYTKLVPQEDMTNAIALNSVAINGARFVGPTIGGLMIGWMGEGYCFLINGIGYTAVLSALLMMRLPRFVPSRTTTRIFRELKEGIAYVNGYLPLKLIILLVASVSFFCMPFMTLVPAVVKDIFGGDSTMLGYVMSSIGAGAMTAAFYLAARRRIRGLGKVVTVAGAMFGFGLIALSFIRIPALAYVVCYPLGLGMITMMASCNTLLQSLVDDDKRGRVMSFYMMAFMGMNPLGGMLAGWAAKYIGIANVLLVSGIICLVAIAIYESYRPIVRRLARDTNIRKGIIPEIAKGLESSRNNPF